MGLSLLVLFSQLNMPLGKTTVIIAHITFSLSYVYVVVTARLSGMGKQLDEAAQDLGATPWQTFRHVTLPQIAPGIISGALIALRCHWMTLWSAFCCRPQLNDAADLYLRSSEARHLARD